MRQVPAPYARTTRRVARLGVLVVALALPGACGDDDPFPGCPGEARLPAFCGVEPDELCTCNQCELQEDGQVRCTLALFQSAATCRADGSDWATCSCPTGRPRAECAGACETMRCTGECDELSVLSCQQRCQDLFDDHEGRRGAPSDACAVAIAKLAVCMPAGGCPQAPLCEGIEEWELQRDLYLSECGSDQ